MKHLYFGDGKGKTTAAVGIAVGAAGSNLKVLFVQFLKTEFSGERHVLSHTENVTLTLCPADLKFTFQMNEKEKAQAAKIFKGIFDHSVTLALTEKYDMVVFDEIIDAINAEMLTESEVVDLDIIEGDVISLEDLTCVELNTRACVTNGYSLAL